MPTGPGPAPPRITPEILAEIRRARTVRRRWAVAIAAAALVAAIFGLRRAGRHFLAAEWLEANSVSVDWQVDAETWRRGGVTAVRARPMNYFLAGDDGGSELRSLADLHRVEELDLANLDGLRDPDLECLGQLADLRVLNLDQAREPSRRRPNSPRLTDATLARLANLRLLRELSLGGAAITDAGLARLAGLSGLENLDLTRTGITDAGLEPLKALKGLKSLTLTGTRVTPAGVRAVEAALPGVTVVFDPPTPTTR